MRKREREREKKLTMLMLSSSSLTSLDFDGGNVYGDFTHTQAADLIYTTVSEQHVCTRVYILEGEGERKRERGAHQA